MTKRPRHALTIHRAYDRLDDVRGRLVLIDRLWPRGLSKAELHLDDWIKDIAPSGALRRWFGHDPSRWERFKQRYFDELKSNPEAVDRIESLWRKGALTLLYGAKDTTHNNAEALKQYLER